AGAHASAEPVVRLLLRLGDGRVDALSKVELDESIRPAPKTRGSFGWTVLDASGRSLAAGGFDDPGLGRHDGLDDSGAMTGGEFRPDSVDFFLKIPWPREASSVALVDARGASLGALALDAIPRQGSAETSGFSVEEVYSSGPSSDRLDIVFV